MRLHRFALLLTLLTGTACAGLGRAEMPSSPTTPESRAPSRPPEGAKRARGRGGGGGRGSSHDPDDHLVQLTTKPDSRGEVRTAWVHLPDGYDPAKAWPVIWAFHGGRDSNSVAMVPYWRSAFDEPFILVFPDGQRQTPTQGAWFVDDGADLRHVDVVRELAALLAASYHVDAERQFATGFSSGAHAVWQLACEAPDMFAAVAPVHHFLLGSYADDCAPAKVPPLLLVASVDDPRASYGGSGDGHNLGARGALAFWAELAGCTADPTREEPLGQGSGDHLYWDGCARAPLEHARLRGVGHEWSRGGGGEADTTALVLDFFQRTGRSAP